MLRALFEDIRVRGATLGESGLDEERFREQLLRDLPTLASNRPEVDPLGRALDEYIEAQVHGRVELARDVEAVVADGSLRDTTSGDVLAEVARVHRIPIHWHAGFRLTPSDIPDEFRGPRVPDLARRLFEGDVDASVLAEGALSMHGEPALWEDWASPEDTLQHLKQLWYCLVAFGRPVLD